MDGLFEPDPGLLQVPVLAAGDLLQGCHHTGKMLVQEPNSGVEVIEVRGRPARRHFFQAADDALDFVVAGQNLLETAPNLSQPGSSFGSLMKKMKNFAAEKIEQAHTFPYPNIQC